MKHALFTWILTVSEESEGIPWSEVLFPPELEKLSRLKIRLPECGQLEKGGGGRGRGRRSKRRKKEGRERGLPGSDPQKKEGLESSRGGKKSPASVTFPPPSSHTHTGTHTHRATGQVWLCGGLVGLADGFASVHYCRLTCAFTGRYRRLGHRLSNIMQRWLSVHGD